MNLSKTTSWVLALVIVLVGMTTVWADEAGQDIQYSKIAKAAIAKIMGRDPISMKVKDYTEKGVYHVSYVRENDKTKWAYLVKFKDNKVIWAQAGMPTAPNYVGRWRDHPLDESITYEVKGDNVKITEEYGDGSYAEITFSLSKL